MDITLDEEIKGVFTMYSPQNHEKIQGLTPPNI